MLLWIRQPPFLIIMLLWIVQNAVRRRSSTSYSSVIAFSIGRTAVSRRTPPRHGLSPSTIVCHLSSNGLTFDDDNDDNGDDDQPQR
jgi:hypothetical protein